MYCLWVSVGSSVLIYNLLLPSAPLFGVSLCLKMFAILQSIVLWDFKVVVVVVVVVLVFCLFLSFS